MKVYGTRGIAGRHAVPLLLGVNKHQFREDLRRSRPNARTLFGGLPHDFKKLRGDYLVAPVSLFSNDEILFNVRAVRERIVSEMSAVRASGVNVYDYWMNNPTWRSRRNERFRSLFKYQYQGNYTHQDLWSLLILDWAIGTEDDPYALAYFKGDMNLGDAFARYLSIFPKESFKQNVIRRHLLDIDRANTIIDLSLWVEMEDAHKARLQSLREVGAIYESYARLWMFIFGLFIGGTEVYLLKVAAEAFVGYMDFMIELYKAEEDGIITPEETQGAWLSLIGVFLPMGQFLGKAVELGTLFVSLGILAISVALALLNALIEVLQKTERSVAAEEEGLDNYVEINMEMSVFIPAQV
jgi:hypothetical protein